MQVELTTAHELSDEDAAAIVKRIEESSGRRVEATRRVDPSLVGGVILQAGSLRVDASVRGRLERLRRELIGQMIGTRSARGREADAFRDLCATGNPRERIPESRRRRDIACGRSVTGQEPRSRSSAVTSSTDPSSSRTKHRRAARISPD